MSADNSNSPPVHDWAGIAAQPEFHALLKMKARFIIKACVFFMLYFFALPISVGWFPEFMKTEVWGKVNIAYLFALSQFFMAWALAALYVKAASKWDKMNAAILAKFSGK